MEQEWTQRERWERGLRWQVPLLRPLGEQRQMSSLAMTPGQV